MSTEKTPDVRPGVARSITDLFDGCRKIREAGEAYAYSLGQHAEDLRRANRLIATLREELDQARPIVQAACGLLEFGRVKSRKTSAWTERPACVLVDSVSYQRLLDATEPLDRDLVANMDAYLRSAEDLSVASSK